MVSDIRSTRTTPTTPTTPTSTTSTTNAVAEAAPTAAPTDATDAAEGVESLAEGDDQAGRFVPGTARFTLLAPVPVAAQPTLAQLPPGLKKGDVGPLVSTLQTALTERGFSAPTSGVLDSQTDKRLKSFQKENGLTATGVADDANPAQRLPKPSERRVHAALTSLRLPTHARWRPARKAIAQSPSGSRWRTPDWRITPVAMPTSTARAFASAPTCKK